MAFRHTPRNAELTAVLRILKIREPKIYEAIRQYEEAVRVDEFKGGGNPADFGPKERDYDEAKLELINLILRR